MIERASATTEGHPPSAAGLEAAAEVPSSLEGSETAQVLASAGEVAEDLEGVASGVVQAAVEPFAHRLSRPRSGP